MAVAFAVGGLPGHCTIADGVLLERVQLSLRLRRTGCQCILWPVGCCVVRNIAQAEARALEEMMAREREAEEKQRIENDLRDKMEIKERELQARQKVVAEMAQKDQSIAELSQQVDRMHKVCHWRRDSA